MKWKDWKRYYTWFRSEGHEVGPDCSAVGCRTRKCSYCEEGWMHNISMGSQENEHSLGKCDSCGEEYVL